MTQKFKGDILELQVEAAAQPAFDSVRIGLDDFYDGGYQASDFLLMLYDQGRMPFSERVPRDSFVAFIKQALPNAQVTGTFESYLFIIKAIFGELSEVLFDVPGPGKLSMLVNASDVIEFDFEGREFVDGAFETFTIETSDDEGLQFRAIAGINSAGQLSQLLSELIPAGIFPAITLDVFALYYFVAEDSLGNLDSIIDNLGNQLVFFETGA